MLASCTLNIMLSTKDYITSIYAATAAEMYVTRYVIIYSKCCHALYSSSKTTSILEHDVIYMCLHSSKINTS